RDPALWPVWARLLPHLLALSPATSSTTQLRNMAKNAAWYLVARGNLAAGYILAQQLHQTWRDRLGDDHPNTIAVANTLMYAHRQRGDYHHACELGQDILTRSRRIGGPNHPGTLTSATNLAELLRLLGRVGEAQALNH